MDEILEGLDGVVTIAGDMCTQGKNANVHDANLIILMNCAAKKALYSIATSALSSRNRSLSMETYTQLKAISQIPRKYETFRTCQHLSVRKTEIPWHDLFVSVYPALC